MKTRQTVFAVLALMMLATLVACGGSSTHTTPPAVIGVSLTSPPASVMESATVPFTAVVTNDTANAGVTWSVSCGATNCGSFVSSTSTSGAANNFTAPATIPAGGVTITATSVTDGTKKATASTTITAAASLADGKYVFSLAGQDAGVSSGLLYYAAGVFTVSGGAITSGEQDFVDYNIPEVSDAITGGSVSTTADGNLQIVLNTADTNVGVGGVETLSGTLVAGNRALINEFDAFATSTGELDLQTSTAASQGGYTFSIIGGNGGGCPLTIGGILTVDSPAAISGTGSVFDINDCGGFAQNLPVDSGSVTSTDGSGRVLISLNLTTSGAGGITLIGYVVDGSRIRVIEDNTDLYGGVTGGTLFAQGTNTGAFSLASVGGSSYVFAANGGDYNGYLKMAGVLTLNADGTVVGTVDANDLTCLCTQVPIAVTGTYTIDATGRVTISGLADAAATFGPYKMQMYLDGSGHGSISLLDGGHLVAGNIYEQTGGTSFSAASFAGPYALDTTGIGFSIYAEFDTVGPVSADGVSVLSGTFDQNILFGAQTAGLTLTDGFTADPSGVFTGTITGLDNTNATTQAAFTYYVIDSTKVVAIQTDPNQLTLGYFELQQ